MKKILLFGLFSILLVFSVSAQNLPTVTIVNNTGYDVWYVFMSSSDDESWGSDLLGNDILSNGQSFTYQLPVPLSEARLYDIMLVDEDEDTYKKFEVKVTNNARIVFVFDDID